MTLLLFQIAIVLLVTLCCGIISKRLGLGRVMGEIAGGILLGPSVFARVWPHGFATLFPAGSLAPFDSLSTLGLVLFLLLIGAELNLGQVRKNKATATLASGMSIAVPLLLAALVSHPLRQRFAPQHTGGWPFFLFLGTALSITALPVLARILEEKGMQATALGSTALMCAALDDVCGWSLLALALTLTPSPGNGPGGSLPLYARLLGLLVYTLVMLFAVRPLAGRIAQRHRETDLPYEALAMAAVLVLASAAITNMLGLHPLLGAFLAGICFPRVPRWQHMLRSRLEMIVSVLLLPLFFALTGMKTRLDLLSGWSIWLWTGVILVVAVAGKVGGGALGARLAGQPWRRSFALGALLNARGLIELIVLNIAYNQHVFSPALFTMMVLMALATTVMTVPLLNLVAYRSELEVPAAEDLIPA